MCACFFVIARLPFVRSPSSYRHHHQGKNARKIASKPFASTIKSEQKKNTGEVVATMNDYCIVLRKTKEKHFFSAHCCCFFLFLARTRICKDTMTMVAVNKPCCRSSIRLKIQSGWRLIDWYYLQLHRAGLLYGPSWVYFCKAFLAAGHYRQYSNKIYLSVRLCELFFFLLCGPMQAKINQALQFPYGTREIE